MVSSGATMPARAPPSMVMLQTVMRPSMESARMASPAYSATWPVPPPMPIFPMMARMMSFAVTPLGRLPCTTNVHSFRFALHEALRGEHVLHFAGADAEGQRAERAVRGGVAVSANDGLAGLRDSEFGTDDVHDALIACCSCRTGARRFRGNCARALQIALGVVVENGQGAVGGGDRVVHHGEGEVRAADFAAFRF